MSRRKKACIVLTAASLLALVLAELVVRAVAPARTRSVGSKLYVADPECGHVLRPDLRPPLTPKATTTRRVLVLGDSFAYGSCAPEDGFPALLAQRLGPGAEVINGGVPGYSTLQELAWLRRFGVAYEPDAVVLAFFVGNDVLENRSLQSGRSYAVVDGELVEERSRRSWLRRLRNRSHLYRHLKRWPKRLKAAASGDSDRLRGFHASEHQRMSLCRDPADWEAAWAKTADALKAIRDLAAPAPVVVLVIPDAFQVDAELRAAVLARFGGRESDLDLDLPQRRLASLCTALGLERVDLLAACRGATGPTYLPGDSHWSPLGHRLAGEALAASKALRP